MASPSAAAGEPRSSEESESEAPRLLRAGRAGRIDRRHRSIVSARYLSRRGRPAARLERLRERLAHGVARRVGRERTPQVFELRLVLRRRRSAPRRLYVGVCGLGSRDGLVMPRRERSEQLCGQRVGSVDRHRRIEGRGCAGRLARTCLEDARAHEHIRGLLRLHIGHRRDRLEHAGGAGRLTQALQPRRGLASQLDVLANRERGRRELHRLVEVSIARREPTRQGDGRRAQSRRVAAGARLFHSRAHPRLLGAAADASSQRAEERSWSSRGCDPRTIPEGAEFPAWPGRPARPSRAAPRE